MCGYFRELESHIHLLSFHFLPCHRVLVAFVFFVNIVVMEEKRNLRKIVSFSLSANSNVSVFPTRSALRPFTYVY